MKIAILANTSWYIVNFRSNLIRRLQDAGHEVYAIAPEDRYSGDIGGLGAAFIALPLSQRGKHPMAELRSILRLRRILKKIQPDVVLSFTVKCNLYAGLCSRLLGCRQIANISGLGEAFSSRGLLHKIVSVLYKVCMRRTQTIFCQNECDLRTLVDSRLLSRSCCKLIPGSGVDLERFAPSASFSENHPRRFLMFGRLVAQKGYEQFLRVAEDLSKRSQHPAELWIMGIEDKSRQESRALLSRILRLHRKGIVTFIPARDDVASVLKEVDVAVLPSQYNEGVPRSLLEAMACGKPLITSDWRGCRETVEDGVNGYLVEPGDWRALKHRIVDLATCSSDLLESMARASRRMAEAKFNEDIVISAYLEEIDRGEIVAQDLAEDAIGEEVGFAGRQEAFDADF